MCIPEEWASMPNRFDNTWGIVKESSDSSAFVPLIVMDFLIESGPFPLKKRSGRTL